MPKEIETKFKIENPARLRKGLNKLGAKFVSKETERDVYYRHVSGRSSASAVRLRVSKGKGMFTVKGMPKGKKSRTYKILDEYEIPVSDAETFSIMLDKLGFKAVFRKKKVRECYKWKGTKILIDRLPRIGFYLEVEAPKRRIREIARLLGLDMSKARSATYMDILKRLT